MNKENAECMILIFQDGMKQHQKLDKPILTPTTKDEDDLPITPAEILEQKLLTPRVGLYFIYSSQTI